MMHGTTEASSSGAPFDGRSLPLPAFSPNRLRTESSAAPLPSAVALSSQTAGVEADAIRPPLDELTWDDLYISQELRTAYFYYKLGVSRLMNNQQSFLVATLKQNNCPVLSHEQVAAIQMKQDPLDWKSFHLRPSKWSTKYYTSTELHRAYMFYSEELSRFSHVGRSAQQMEKALNSAECPVLTRYEIAEIQRRRKREMQAAATAVAPDGQAQPSVLRKRRVVRRRTGLVDSDVVLPARTRKRVPVSPADADDESKSFSFGQSLQEFAAPRPMKRVRSQARPVQRSVSPVASYSSLAESPLNSLSLLPSFSFSPIQQHQPAPAPVSLPHFPLPEYPYALPNAPSFLAPAPMSMAPPSAPSHGMVVGPLSLSNADDFLGSPFKSFENDPFFSLQNEPAYPQSPLSVSSAEWDSGHSDLSSPSGGSPVDDLMSSPSNVASLTLPSSVVPAPVQMSGYPMQPQPHPLSMSAQQFTFSDLAGMSQPQYQSYQSHSQSRLSFVPPPQYAIAPDQPLGLLDGVAGWN